ncbi:MAG: asparagine synthetase B family protein [Thermoanaerobaculia bacterium]|nr:asparagine synthetase B family protein [Thermoanaerobaculia bacterium]
MSSFVCVLDRGGGEIGPGLLDSLAASLPAEGGELAAFRRGPVGIAVRSPRGGRPGVRLGGALAPQAGTVLAVVGRQLPDGTALAAASEGAEGRRREERGGPLLRDEELGSLRGGFVLIAADPGEARIEIALDHLGGIPVCYALDRSRLIAASGPSPILRGGLSADPDEERVARFLGFRFGATERSYFRGIRELPPAHRLRVGSSHSAVERYWRFPEAGGESFSGREAADGLRGLLEEAVGEVETGGLEAREVAVSLSGGLDSSSVAAVAPRGVTAFSWTFEDDPEADERDRIRATARKLDLEVRWLPGDGLHPLCDGFEERFVRADSPHLNPFAALKARLYAAAREAGCARVLVGDGGDALGAVSDLWLRDLLADAGRGAARGLAGTVGRAARGDRFARRSLRRLLPAAPAPLRRRRAPWLTRRARALLPEEPPSPNLPETTRLCDRLEAVAGSRHRELEAEEQRLAALCGAERGDPYWSWPLLAFAASLPAYRHHRDGRSKLLVREAFRSRLPEEVVEGGRTGLLGGFFLRGIEARRADLRRLLFERARSDWPRWVRREWLEPYLSPSRSIAFGHTILWRVIGYELWCRRLARGG